MEHLEIEAKLKKRIVKRRIIEFTICIALLIFAISFTVAYEHSKVVEIIDLGFIEHQSVTYNADLMWGVALGWILFFPCAIWLICDFIFSRLSTIEVSGNYITYYRGNAHIDFYVNGEHKDGLVFGYHLEFSLPDRTKVSVAVGKWSVHPTFSNGHPSVDL